MVLPTYPPISATYYTQQVARASAVLVASPGWDATPIEMVCAYFYGVTLTFTYDANDIAVGPAFEWYVDGSQYSIAGLVPAGANEWGQGSIYAPGIVVAGTDIQSQMQREYFRYTAVGLTAESFQVQIEFTGPLERLRIFARESGDIVNIGNLQVEALFR